LEQHLYAIRIADIYDPEIKKKLININKSFKGVFPSSDIIYSKDIVKENDPNLIKPPQTRYIKKKYYEDKKKFYPSQRKYLLIDNDDSMTDNGKENDYINNNYSEENEKMLNENKKIINTIYIPKQKSRFNFISQIESKNEETVEIPNFIQDLILKKVSRYNFTKHIKNLEDILYSDQILTTNLEKKDPWAHFIIENKTYDYDRELIEDFNFINSLVLNKCKHIK
jgi:hypothetical protein